MRFQHFFWKIHFRSSRNCSVGHIRTILTIIMLLNVIVFPGFLTGKIAPHAFLLVFLASFLAHFFCWQRKHCVHRAKRVSSISVYKCKHCNVTILVLMNTNTTGGEPKIDNVAYFSGMVTKMSKWPRLFWFKRKLKGSYLNTDVELRHYQILILEKRGKISFFIMLIWGMHHRLCFW